MTDLGKLLLVLGGVIILAGAVLLLAGRFNVPLGRLPGIHAKVTGAWLDVCAGAGPANPAGVVRCLEHWPDTQDGRDRHLRFRF